MLLLLLGCDLTQIGAYTCDEYCDQVISKTEECASVYAEDQCAEAGVPAEDGLGKRGGDIRLALAVPLICYAIIASFGLWVARPATA